MKQWKNILQRGDDVFTASSRGLDRLALKPEIPSEQKPIFRLGYEGGLVCRRELRSEEEYLKSFTPFVNKKTPEYLEAMRKAWFEPNGLDDSIYDMFFGGQRTAADAVREQEEFEDEEESVFSFGPSATLFSHFNDAEETVASDIRGILERHEPSSEARASVADAIGGGGVSAALPYGGSEDLEAKRTELERVQDTLQKIHEIQEKVTRLRQPPEEGVVRAPLIVGGVIERAEAEIERLYRSMGRSPGEIKAMMKESEVELRYVPEEVQESVEFKSWQSYFERTGKNSRSEQVEHARSLGVTTRFVAPAKRTNHAAIIYGLLKAGKRPPLTIQDLRASVAARGGAARGGAAGGGGGR